MLMCRTHTGYKEIWLPDVDLLRVWVKLPESEIFCRPNKCHLENLIRNCVIIKQNTEILIKIFQKTFLCKLCNMAIILSSL